MPALYREAGWQVGEPIDVVDRGAWWSVYNDAVLDGLKKQIDITNQNLKAAEAAFQQAEWIVAQARAGYFSSATSMPVHSARATAAPPVVGRLRSGVAGPVAGSPTSSAHRPRRAGPRICGDSPHRPAKVLRTTGNVTANAIKKIFDPSLMPNQRTASGKRVRGETRQEDRRIS